MAAPRKDDVEKLITDAAENLLKSRTFHWLKLPLLPGFLKAHSTIIIKIKTKFYLRSWINI